MAISTMLKKVKLKKASGFSILEALIAFFVITLGALAIAGLLNNSMEMNSDAEARTEALHIAKGTIAEFRDFTTKAEVVAYMSNTIGNTVVGDHETFTRTWTVADVTGNANAVLLTVNVTWTGVNGAQIVTLTSEIAKLRPQQTGAFVMTQSVKGTGPGSTTSTTSSTSSTTSTTTTTQPGDTTTRTSSTSSTSTSSTSTTSTSTTTTTTTTTEEPTTTTTTTNSPILYTCYCTFAATPSGFCDGGVAAVSEPSGGSCCNSSACRTYVPATQACKNNTYSTSFTCSGDPYQ